MGSQSKRQKARQQRRRRANPAPRAFDPHAKIALDSMTQLENLVERFATMENPGAAIEAAFDESVAALAEELLQFDPIRLIEVARLATLPFAPEGENAAVGSATPGHLELLALVALAAQAEAPSAPAEVEPQAMSQFIHESMEKLMELFHLAELRAVALLNPDDTLGGISLLVHGSEIWIRNTSYPEMVATTNLELLDGQPEVRATLVAELGFDAHDALVVLDACHDAQMERMNERGRAWVDSTNAAENAAVPTPELLKRASEAFFDVFEPNADAATVSLEELVTRAGLPEARVLAVVDRFRLDLSGMSSVEVADAFLIGNNPLRTRPLIVTRENRLMLPHNAMNLTSLRENIEEHLKCSAIWEKYAHHRGYLLESRTRAALDRVLPGAQYRDAFEYYVPANDAELDGGDPSKYTKRVEGDHLVVLGDVAIIVEDKAVALSALARGGKSTRLKTDLTGIITKAAAQAGRLRDCIERDGGVRFQDEGWVDLSEIREIHTIAVSLDDMSTVLTATASLVEAGLVSLDNIPWTVSLHDLDLITELAGRPAEFLLYLRRRREPNTTVMFSAPDELDLFLYFLDIGLWVEPDPDQVRMAFPFLDEVSTAARRRYRAQKPLAITSRTDPLDLWHATKGRPDAAPKPIMSAPIAPLADELQRRNVPSWLSIGATLLAADERTQHQFARNAADLLNAPADNGLGRSLTVPITSTTDPAEAWLLVWATLPSGAHVAATIKELRQYVRAKKYQLGIPRGALLLYDESTRDLIDVTYDGHIGPLDSATAARLSALRPAGAFTGRLHPNAKASRQPTPAPARPRPKRPKKKSKRKKR